jgi:hypothetical protein
VERCLEADGQLLAHLAQEDVGDSRTAETAARISDLLESALSQHRGLHHQLITAPAVFLEEQKRQELNRRGHAQWRTSVRAGLLEPLVAMRAGVARPVLERFLVLELGPVAPRTPHLGRLFDKMLDQRPRVEVEAPDDEIDLDELPSEPETISRELVEQARSVLSRCRSGPCLLSDLLVAAGEAQDVAELVRLSVLWCFGAEHDDEPALAGELIDEDIVALRSGATFQSGPWSGDDLVVGTAADLGDC